MRIYNENIYKNLPDGVLFDTDNTLYPYDIAHQSAMEEVRNRFIKDFNVNEKIFDKIYTQSRNMVKNQLDGTASSHSRLLYFQYMLENLGLGSQVMHALDLEQAYWRVFLSNANLFDNVLNLLEDIRILTIPSIIVTDLTSQIQFRKMVYFGLDKYFNYIVTSEEAGFDKPHKAPFELAIKKIKDPGKTIWMIGDNHVNDIRGAKESINAFTLQKNHAGVEVDLENSKPDVLFEEFNDIRLLLKKIQNG